MTLRTLLLTVGLALIICKPAHSQIDSLDIKIGQMLLVGVNEQRLDSSAIILKEIASGKVGGVILFEKNITAANSYIHLKQLTFRLQKSAKIPLFIAIDQEGGMVNRLKEKYQFPKSVTQAYLGELDNADSTRFYGEITASTLAGLGFNVNFAPVVDMAVNPDNPIIAKYGRAFADSAAQVTKHASIIVEAHRKYGVVTVLKHFPGHGSSKSDTHLGIADVTAYWQEREIAPYRDMIANDKVDAIMTAHIVNKNLDKKGLPSTLSKPVIGDLLRDSLNFDGVVFTDDMQMHAITEHYGLEKAIELAINAGVDVMLFSNNIQGSEDRTIDTVHAIIKKLVSSEAISEERINESYRRIMKLKTERL